MEVEGDVPFILTGKYFQILKRVENKVEALCKNCNSSGSKTVFKGSISVTTNFHKHLKCKHRDLVLQFEKDNEEFRRNKRGRFPGLTAADILGSVMNGYVKKDESKSISKHDKLILSFVVNGMHPLSVVEEPSFVKLLKGLNDAVHVPSRRTLGRLIDSAYTQLHQRTINQLNESKYLCLTADIWTCGGMSRSFMGVTAHWIGDSNAGPVRKSVALGCGRFKGSHTYDRIAEHLSHVIKEYNIGTKTSKIVTDNASNFEKAFRVFSIGDDNTAATDIDDTEFANLEEILINQGEADEFEGSYKLPSQLKCASHTLSLICTTDLSKYTGNQIQKATFGKCYGIWNKIGRSTQVSESVKGICSKSLQTPGKTRWNSFFDSLTDLLQFENVLKEICKICKVPEFSETEITFMKDYCRCVQPIAVALDRLQGENRTFYGELIPVLLNTEDKLKNLLATSPQNTKKLLELLLASLRKRFNKFLTLDEEHNDAIIASVSHPLFKLRWVPSAQLEKVKSVFLNKVLDQETEFRNVQVLPNSTNIDSESEAFFGFGNSGGSAGLASESTEIAIKQQCVQYFLDSDTSMHILNKYPVVKGAFIKFNTPLPSSAPVERLFSYTNMILCPRRRSLNDDLFEKLTLMKVNGF